jgi:hemerythrin
LFSIEGLLKASSKISPVVLLAPCRATSTFSGALQAVSVGTVHCLQGLCLSGFLIPYYLKTMCEQLAQISEAEQSLHEMVDRLQQCADINVPDAYHAVMRTTEHLFWLEQELMETYDFPSRQIHLEQHARVLRGLHCAHSAVLRGSAEHGRHAGGKLLLDWLAVHRDTMDAVLTIWVSYCESGLVDNKSRPQMPTVNAH